ncbi:hypothetical protein HanRHA438_Chr09g0380201 [Helianthus annuus]|nr:hypothetical protein HanRHA438_Chr09g0380201 [Helianthus annuus]
MCGSTFLCFVLHFVLNFASDITQRACVVQLFLWSSIFFPFDRFVVTHGS